MNKISLHTASLALLVVSCSGKLDVGNPASGGAGATGGNPWGGGGMGGTGDGGYGAGIVGGNAAIAGHGSLAEACFEGKLALEAQGTPAEAEVRTLDHCNQGYSCGPDGSCSVASRCAEGSTSECIIYESPGAGGENNSTGGFGTGGSFSTGNPTNTGGTLGANNPAAEQPPITGIAADDSHVYWIAYGSRDKLGNFNNDGALMAYSLSERTTTTLAGELAGPIRLGVTSSHAYFIVDGAPLIGSPTEPRLLRVPLSGGSPEILQKTVDLWGFGGFIAAGSQAFWADGASVYTMTADSSTKIVFLADPGWPVASDDSHLYYSLAFNEIWRMPIAGGAGQMLVSPVRPLGVSGGYLYGVEGIENETASILVRVPVGGGAWVRVRALGSGAATSQFQITGDRFFFDGSPPEMGSYMQQDSWRMTVVTGSLSSESAPVRVLERPRRRNLIDGLWVGSANALFWSDGNAVYSRPLAQFP